MLKGEALHVMLWTLVRSCLLNSLITESVVVMFEILITSFSKLTLSKLIKAEVSSRKLLFEFFAIFKTSFYTPFSSFVD